jgi:hypothetical protein
VVGGRPGRTPGPRGAGGYVSEPHMPVTTATRPYPRITLFFYFYPPPPSRRPARTHARFFTSRWGKSKRRHVLKSAPGAHHNAPLRLNLPLIFLFSIGGPAHPRRKKRLETSDFVQDMITRKCLATSFPLATEELATNK